MDDRTLYLVVTGASSPRESVADLVRQAREREWAVTVISSPMGTRFHDVHELAGISGDRVRVDFRLPGTGERLPPPDALLACPLTFNSLNKIAAGFADTMAVAVACEMLGHGVPTVCVPHLNGPLARHPAAGASVQALRGMGARVLFDPDAPAEDRLPQWKDVLNALDPAAD
ncbi:flavoprotein [Streptomonospora wellingtoniae]|uniref:Flavoprotein n=1 Tax=Streptomonospora wellingtoniae TaxID=3075544 RepID=A0ABU2KV46_9ACTN|nr:flavoprotein [Streptomonospora sp. DSM 45055]MDT0303164.1 flavoprotein [Streptomonospora sp. DSM 45055]